MLFSVRKISFLLLFIQFNSGLFAQENSEQKLIDMLTGGRYFEAKEYYTQEERDEGFAPFFQLYYKYETAKMLNKPDSASIFLEKLLEDGDQYFGLGKYQFYDALLTLYTFELQDYKKAMLTCEKIQESLDNNYLGEKSEIIGNDPEYVETRKKQIQEIENQSPIVIAQNNLDNTVKIKDRDNSLFFNATYNQKTFETLFDTGVSLYFYINENIADSIGVKRTNSLKNDSSVVLNGVLLGAEKGIIDSIKIANFKLYNIPVVIYNFDPKINMPDSLLNDYPERKKIIKHFSQLDVVMGYPAMLLMGKIMIDFKNKTLSLPNRSFMQQPNVASPNMFVYSNGLYTRLFINNIPFTVLADFGSTSYMQLHSSFYEKHRDKIPIKTLAVKKPLNVTMLHKTWLNIPYEIPKDPSLIFNCMSIPVKNNNQIEIYSLPEQQVPAAFDGHIGYPFFRNLGEKILLDFKNMRIDVIE